MMILDNAVIFLPRNKGCTFLTIGYRKVLTLHVDTILADFTPNSIDVGVDFSSADAAIFPFEVLRFCPTVRDGILHHISRNSRAWTDYRVDASIMDNKVTHFTNVPLFDESPQHIGTMMTINWFWEGFLVEKVTVTMLVIFGCRRGSRFFSWTTCRLFTPSWGQTSTWSWCHRDVMRSQNLDQSRLRNPETIVKLGIRSRSA